MRTGKKAALVLATTFLLGAAAGALGVGAVLHPPGPDGPPGPASAAADGRPTRFVTDMERLLQPRDSAQRAALRPFLMATDSANRATVSAAHDSMLGHIRRLDADLAPLLDARQVKRLREFIGQKTLETRGPSPVPSGGP
jgi:hypothetical protein